jgi:rhodanese-related sulfurtransferase
MANAPAAAETATTTQTPHLELLRSPAERAELAGPDSPAELRHAAPAASPASASAPVPVAQVHVPTQPTARIHWIGGFVDQRHPADLWQDLVAGTPNLIVVDARYAEAYEREHLPGAINLPVRDLDEAATAHLSRDALYVVYCWNESCHASAKAAQRLEALGFKVKELHGGLQTWRKQGYPTERG